MHLQELKSRSPSELLAYAEELEVENASALRTQDMMFAILKQRGFCLARRATNGCLGL